MAALPDNLRQAIFGSLLQDWHSKDPLFNLAFADIRAAVNATDDWIDTNMASFNGALPEPARSTLSTDQKEFVFLLVANYRFTQE